MQRRLTTRGHYSLRSGVLRSCLVSEQPLFPASEPPLFPASELPLFPAFEPSLFSASEPPLFPTSEPSSFPFGVEPGLRHVCGAAMKVGAGGQVAKDGNL